MCAQRNTVYFRVNTLVVQILTNAKQHLFTSLTNELTLQDFFAFFDKYLLQDFFKPKTELQRLFHLDIKFCILSLGIFCTFKLFIIDSAILENKSTIVF